MSILLRYTQAVTGKSKNACFCLLFLEYECFINIQIICIYNSTQRTPLTHIFDVPRDGFTTIFTHTDGAPDFFVCVTSDKLYVRRNKIQLLLYNTWNRLVISKSVNRVFKVSFQK